ncbi:2-oxoisovalerate dehydrogenase subunit alpha, mitochondrial-like [Sycon ciliatum]|uniref:2-oxoisovalerate dehydrogenase subunit alpha, mitochondrial-like n=1 Tax=Sycon ciliatum TaxID=27933 RepID=UPI0020AC3BE9|eukprot:scpid67581/ scgid7064/ 2-oxoisovalerate dehydrogenase subunit alpha, mitochondrial; Branched-chain alpha-keto acid dehydrogenase E1 component alpha chain
MALACGIGRRFLARNLRPQVSQLLSRPMSSTVEDIDGNDRARYPGQRPGQYAHFVSQPTFQLPDNMDPMPVYRVLDRSGEPIEGAEVPDLSREVVQRMYNVMLQLNEMDKVLYDVQRQGGISFYMTAHGEEGTLVGSAAALNNKDPVFAQYREAAVLMWRDFSVQQCVHQCFGNRHDFGKGKQMPVHYGSAKHSYVTISSPLTTQLPQASGAAYALKRASPDLCTITYFGDGAASEGDAHAAMNFAATLECPMIFICRNNGYAISTPTSDQYRGDGIAARGVGYGMNTIRVDGNDVFAVYNVIREARKMALEQQRPVLVEAMTYRAGHHSTSDDSTAYRSKSEVGHWEDTEQPINRLSEYMKRQGWLQDGDEEALREEFRDKVFDAVDVAEKENKPPMISMFEDVYDEMPDRLKRQYQFMKEHVDRNSDKYPVGSF